MSLELTNTGSVNYCVFDLYVNVRVRQKLISKYGFEDRYV